MAGINRLGKAPPKPGQLRPPDPNKYRTVDMFSEGAEGDADYVRMVQDIEDMQQQQGWLFGRGAFDKGDLLYLRDEAERQRHAELELRDSEKTQFAALRAKFEQQDGQSDVVRIARKGRTSGMSQPELLAHVVKVKGQGSTEVPDPGGCDLEQPSLKRMKYSASSCPKDTAALDSDGDPASGKLHGSCGVSVSEVAGADVQDELKSAEAETGQGLGGLLGDYASSSEDEDEGDCDGNGNGGRSTSCRGPPSAKSGRGISKKGDAAPVKGPVGRPNSVSLPDARELLGLGRTGKGGKGEGYEELDAADGHVGSMTRSMIGGANAERSEDDDGDESDD
ncbi:unnamed protein product [Ostreobium quekettii]|uniref:Uncharacterized protein n=1 Tax=Ostreobium quekettii TaxID=121088 RepID=A0A8S1IPY4_9CHLO|nr:unnamed protein product [Ostreobium quekettii]